MLTLCSLQLLAHVLYTVQKMEGQGLGTSGLEQCRLVHMREGGGILALCCPAQ